MRNNRRSIAGKIMYIILLATLLLLLQWVYQNYELRNFNNFIKSERHLHTSSFTRDNEVKYSEKSSYKITSNEYNDAMFYEKIKVQKNQPYKITCMVKTNNVVPKSQSKGIGAQISIEGSTEKSVSVQGTSDWQKIELIFNSKDREEINLGFRLGGNLGEAKGEAWFSDFMLEEGTIEENNKWKFACIIFKNTNVNVNGKQVKLSVTTQDVVDIKNTINRFETCCETLSESKMVAECDIYEISTPLSELSYDSEFGYYVAPENVEENIKSIIEKNDYDHIFAIIRLGDDKHQNDIEVNDWIGLGAMDYYGIGFSNIRLPNDNQSYVYKYNSIINQFPEEVFLHEFLHTLERNAKEYKYERPNLHDYEKYGYENERLTGQKEWYRDYMNGEIRTSNGNIGLPQEIYKLKPAKSSNFKYSYKMDQFKQPENFIEVIHEIIGKITIKFKNTEVGKQKANNV